MDGDGSLDFADGNVYIGKFKDNSINGYGTMYNGRPDSKKTEVIFCGVWKDAAPIDFVPLVSNDQIRTKK
jgi:hypothetical protein